MVKPRRTYTPEFKVRVVLEMLTSKKSLSQASREYGIKDSVLSRWRQEFLERAPQIFEQGQAEDSQAQRIAELERLVGRQALQLDMAKKVFGSSDFLLKGDE
jgi:transposase-like protein